MRRLAFSDDKGNERAWIPGGPHSAVDAFWEFADQYRDDDNAAFSIEDEKNEEALTLLFDLKAVCRVKGTQNPRAEYRVVTNRGDYRTQVANFARGGFAALDFHGPWLPDAASLARARLRFEFDGSVLRRTHPRELRRRLEILTCVDGRQPRTDAGVTRLGFGNSSGDTVDAWFTAAGRGLVVTFDHAGPLNSAAAHARAALYDGVPADLLDLARVASEAAVASAAPHRDGGTLVAATGVFTLSGPCAMADGLVAHLQEAQLEIEDTGVGRLLEIFLAPEDFTPAAVAQAADWWSAEDIARGFAAVAALEAEQPTAPLDREAVERFCRTWADSGYNDRWDVHYVLFDSCALEEVSETRVELLELVRTLGLDHVDAPPEAATGEVWIRTDPRIDAELEHWS
ncbi:DUF6357 family protein [Saccharothrix espanaensis]|uniref:Uncharacterized protein n=1 Tax=Saccharothrix espanaensis (strain ATCC 51144 / DSM 44229 / JCM 9112 / NBRC 15066 / NRRL 15764) TaxID=1179773 RepID=K0K1Q1_SACES|nr:hypothetical protein BN6_50030 [Saccharothrix espanaensis DSM 44229]